MAKLGVYVISQKPTRQKRNYHLHYNMNIAAQLQISTKRWKVKVSMHKDVPAPLVLGKNKQKAQVE